MKKNDFSTAVKALKDGEPIIYPTDTLYALGADIYNETAVRKVYDIKRRPYSVPLPVAVGSIPAIETIANTNEASRKVSEMFLPGNLTIILKKKQSVPDIVTGGSDSVAVRVPNDSIALKLLSQYGPLTITSANIHHIKTLSTIPDILRQLETSIPVCLDDGKRAGTASTIVDVSAKEPQIVRKGSISEKEIMDVISHG
ncbi:MAG TPA: threonylcarbamoyl-AMP synthase [Thermoplasmata archaeon]|jgi:L-threonylcarbamoyladenylate synthase|nr:MAG TPA: threonylcarbamoyl-AMP synthase [Thermoplasmata archaeon]